MNKNLSGIKEITGYAKRSWTTISIWICNEGFPAKKMEGVWESQTDLIDKWKADKITQKAT